MNNSKRLKIMLSVLFVIIIMMLSCYVYYNYTKHHRTIINSYLDIEQTIIKEVAKASKLWFYKRIQDKGATVEAIEQEIFTQFVDPICLLKNGDAWIYNKNYVIFDKSSDFPDIYKGKSMREIFDLQKAKGAWHYDELIYGVENATDGKGWYVWLPEKGKEWVAWTSFKFHDQTWTIGLSTPEKEILEHSGVYLFLKKQIIYASVIILMLLGGSIFVIRFQKKQDKLIAQIHDANEALKNIDSMKNDFIVNISHDFRTPLTIIYSLSELNLAEEQNLGPKLRSDLKTIFRTSYKFLSKINTLQNLTKLEISGLKLKICEVDLNDFVSTTAAHYKSALERSGKSLELKLPPKAGARFYTDIEKLEDIINNLISNAIKFTAKDNGKISLELQEFQDYLIISVADNGLGIDKEEIDSIFSRYKQGSNAKRIHYEGSGIGLNYSRQLARLIGGDIKAQSQGALCGSVFSVTLPKKKFTQADIDPADCYEDHRLKPIRVDHYVEDSQKSVVRITDTNRQDEFDPYKGVILIVEDEPIIREIIIRYLTAAGYKNFITATDGKAAIGMFEKYNPDLVITDYVMPNMKGDEFFSIISADDEYDFNPFIFISAVVEEKIILEQKNRGAVDFLLKPIKKNELLVSVNTNMKKYMDFIKISGLDELTGLLNRRFFFRHLKNTLLNPGILNLSLIMFDLDHFKKVNDTYGHQAGDYILKSVCSTILSLVRSRDIAGRYGGEEFTILLPETKVDQALIVAEKLRSTIENQTFEYEGKTIRITISLGISSLSLSEPWASDPDTRINHVHHMIKMADKALYCAKSAKCPSCSILIQDPSKDEKFCPECGSKLITPRNRVEIYHPQNFEPQKS